MSKTVIEVKKNNNENNASLLRRFQRRVIESGIVSHVKGKRYNERATSKLSGKVMKLKKLARGAEIEKLKKLGKMPEKTHGRR
jgi:ribosomal protein S21